MTHIDSDAFIAWEKGKFNLPAWAEENDEIAFSATAWQQLFFGVLGWEAARAAKRRKFLELVSAPIVDFGRSQAERAASIEAQLKSHTIGFADCQIAACAIEDGADLLTFNREHFQRVPGLSLAKP
ncbi:MAG TPA: PIN domain-containing protein [Verrucomicrobiae bacterium]|nr:PIN domain-containing protein [Verrucomicrobiae bacterium]